jgi:PAS domain-containing protein
MFPRVVVRERTLSGEESAWYVYRDGGWRSALDGNWWEDESLPRVVVTQDGWLTHANPTAAGLLGLDPNDAVDHHFTDFVVPGTLDDSMALFTVVGAGDAITATILLRPTTGGVIAVDLRASRHGSEVFGVFRLAQEIEITVESAEVARPASVATKPRTDVAFRAYALRALRRMPEPTLDGLALRIRRLYPHAIVHADGQNWIAEREADTDGRAVLDWWSDTSLPRVRYNAQALILEANEPAQQFLGHELVGHHWQDFVTPGTSDEVTVMLEILAEMGAAESRFRMPRGDGSLVEFDSYTTVLGEEFLTVMRPASSGASPP